MAEKTQDSGGAEYAEIPLAALYVSEHNVRHRERSADIDQLAHNIATVGLLQPIVVRQVESQYEILIGQRRFEAFKFLGRDTIPARIVRRDLNQLDILALSFSENVLRKDLEAADKADVCVYLVDQLGSIGKAAEYLGVSVNTIRYWLDYAGVPEPIKQMVAEGRIKKGVATTIWIAAKDDVAQAQRMAELVADKKPTVQERNRLVHAFQEEPERPIAETEARAREAQFELRVTVEFPPDIARALRSASRETDKDVEDVVRDATVSYLETAQFLIAR